MNNRYAVITGGSSGLGFELAKLFAADGYDLLIGGVSDRVFEAVEQLEHYGTTVVGVKADLSTEEGVATFLAKANEKGRPIDDAVLNAGISLGGGFLDIPLDKQLSLLNLNVTSLVKIAYNVIPGMVEKGSGRVLLMSSLSATTPTPYESIYGPTKAFISSFGHGLREELIGTGVQITLFHPGATATTFHARAGMNSNIFSDNSWKNDPALVAQQGYQGLLRGQTSVVGSDAATHRAWNDNHILPEEEKARRFAEASRPSN
ncbi:LADA_0A01838g1_1 [Lachancea dasiensis]|uniref:LADA_0A01838g1_1 n=1 Tax=Lachancea dasiensis TaxID=1072105 RepID=A0A1G4IMC8_9SACH|nr:LADA_0A01838g1_1 [Lachancea dasiensis]